MDYKVVITSDAEEDLEAFIVYILFEKKNEQAAQSVLDDFEATVDNLARVAGSLKLCENPKLKKYGYRRINFLSHNYFMMYRLEGNVAVVENIFHDLQDYENKMM